METTKNVAAAVCFLIVAGLMLLGFINQPAEPADSQPPDALANAVETNDSEAFDDWNENRLQYVEGRIQAGEGLAAIDAAKRSCASEFSFYECDAFWGTAENRELQRQQDEHEEELQRQQAAEDLIEDIDRYNRRLLIEGGRLVRTEGYYWAEVTELARFTCYDQFPDHEALCDDWWNQWIQAQQE